MKRFLQAGELCVGRRPGKFWVLGLGSCVAVALYDAESSVGGLAHILLPEPLDGEVTGNRARFACTAVPDLVSELEAAGATRERLEARLVGGASMLQELVETGRSQIGERNVSAAREALRLKGIRIVGEAVGGDRGRSMEFDLTDGRVRIWSYGVDDVQL